MSCKERTEVYSRVVGYYRPVQQWNKGKQEEYYDRKNYAVTTLIAASQAVATDAKVRNESAA